MKSRGIAVVVLLGALALAGCQSESDRALESKARAERLAEANGAEAAPAESTTAQVRYEVAAGGGIKIGNEEPIPFVNVTEVNATGMSQSEPKAPYSSTRTLSRGAAAGITAQAGTDVTSVRCAIYADGVKIAEEKSTGAYAVVSCSALVP